MKNRIGHHRRLKTAWVAGTGVALCCATACGDSGKRNESGDELAGTAVVHLSAVPAAVRCLQIEAAGASRTELRAFDLTPGSSATSLELGRIPVRTVRFTGLAFDAACVDLGASPTPDYASEPVTATVVPRVAAQVSLLMLRNGRASIGTTWEDGDAAAPDASAPEPPSPDAGSGGPAPTPDAGSAPTPDAGSAPVPTNPTPGPTAPPTSFPPPTARTLVVSLSGPGFVLASPGGPCTGTCEFSYFEPQPVNLSIDARDFRGWGDACASFGTQPRCSVVMDQSKKVSAMFGAATPGPGPTPIPTPVVVAQTGVTAPTAPDPFADLHPLDTGLMPAGTNAYDLRVMVTTSRANGFVTVYPRGSRLPLAQASCRTPENGPPTCTGSAIVSLDKNQQYEWALRLTDSLTGTYLAVGATAQVVTR